MYLPLLHQNIPQIPQNITKSLFVASLLGTAHVHAAAILYWEGDGNTNNSGSGSSLNGTAAAWNGTAVGGTSQVPTYSSSVPGTIITAGVGGAPANLSNTNSFSFVNAGLPGAVDSKAGGIIYAANTGLSVTTVSNFTVEAFVNTLSLASFSTVFNMSNSLGVSWMLDTDNASGRLRLRADTATAANQAQVAGITSPVINDGAWHHIAVTYNGSAFTVYLDYAAVITNWNPTGDVLFESGYNFNVGAANGRAFNGLIDEVRFSDTVLGANDLLRAIPEPTSALLLGGLSLFGLLRRSRG